MTKENDIGEYYTLSDSSAMRLENIADNEESEHYEKYYVNEWHRQQEKGSEPLHTVEQDSSEEECSRLRYQTSGEFINGGIPVVSNNDMEITTDMLPQAVTAEKERMKKSGSTACEGKPTSTEKDGRKKLKPIPGARGFRLDVKNTLEYAEGCERGGRHCDEEIEPNITPADAP